MSVEAVHPTLFRNLLDKAAAHPGWFLQLASLAAALSALYYGSVPGGHGMLFFLVILFAWMCIGLVWLVRLGLTIGTRGSAFFTRRALAWLVAPALAILSIVAVFTSLPVVARFYVSLPAMNSYAEAFVDGTSDRHPSWIGTYPVKEVEPIPGGMRFLISGAEFLDEYGFAYSPDRRPPRIGEDNYVHIRGPWYVWEQSW